MYGLIQSLDETSGLDYWTHTFSLCQLDSRSSLMQLGHHHKAVLALETSQLYPHVPTDRASTRINWLLKFYIDYWNFGDNQSINRLFSESGQH